MYIGSKYMLMIVTWHYDMCDDPGWALADSPSIDGFSNLLTFETLMQINRQMPPNYRAEFNVMPIGKKDEGYYILFNRIRALNVAVRSALESGARHRSPHHVIYANPAITGTVQRIVWDKRRKEIVPERVKSRM